MKYFAVLASANARPKRRQNETPKDEQKHATPRKF